ncbi:MAG: methyl-accepting chemotaxis protein [Candidatus Hydrogenedentes bacterium]|nr:methyl-accepting chemotaxis protein [Candidatus Hydrogenedentota bacterium]
MSLFLNLSTRAKLMVAFGVELILLAAVIGAAYAGLSIVRSMLRSMHEFEFAEVSALIELRAHQNLNRALVLQLYVSEDPAQHAEIQAEMEETTAYSNENLANLMRLNQSDPAASQKLQELETVIVSYRQTRAQAIDLFKQGRRDEALLLSAGVQAERFESIRGITEGLTQDRQLRAANRVAQADRIGFGLSAVFAVFAVFALLFGVGAGVFLNRIIATPLTSVAAAARSIANGDLSREFALLTRTDEVGILAQSFNAMSVNLREINRKLKNSAATLAASAGEIAVSSTQVSSGATETAAAVNETTSTVEEVRQTANVAAQKARAVSDSAQAAAGVAQQGQRAVELTVESMEAVRNQMALTAASVVRLSEQGQAIGDIITAVNDLAEQSNLLAVNAAIEAARAGDQGAGFGVVAQEVRSLAEQSKQATAQVRTILNDIQRATSSAVMATEQGNKSVETCVELVAQAFDSIRRLSDSMAESAQAATQIAASCQQQFAGLDQVAAAMENINRATAQNLAGTRQTEEAARGLRQLGQEMKEIVDQFTV